MAFAVFPVFPDFTAHITEVILLLALAFTQADLEANGTTANLCNKNIINLLLFITTERSLSQKLRGLGAGVAFQRSRQSLAVLGFHVQSSIQPLVQNLAYKEISGSNMESRFVHSTTPCSKENTTNTDKQLIVNLKLLKLN